MGVAQCLQLQAQVWLASSTKLRTVSVCMYCLHVSVFKDMGGKKLWGVSAACPIEGVCDRQDVEMWSVVCSLSWLRNEVFSFSCKSWNSRIRQAAVPAVPGVPAFLGDWKGVLVIRLMFDFTFVRLIFKCCAVLLLLLALIVLESKVKDDLWFYKKICANFFSCPNLQQITKKSTYLFKRLCFQ